MGVMPVSAIEEACGEWGEDWGVDDEAAPGLSGCTGEGDDVNYPQNDTNEDEWNSKRFCNLTVTEQTVIEAAMKASIIRWEWVFLRRYTKMLSPMSSGNSRLLR